MEVLKQSITEVMDNVKKGQKYRLFKPLIIDKKRVIGTERVLQVSDLQKVEKLVHMLELVPVLDEKEIEKEHKEKLYTVCVQKLKTNSIFSKSHAMVRKEYVSFLHSFINKNDTAFLLFEVYNENPSIITEFLFISFCAFVMYSYYQQIKNTKKSLYQSYILIYTILLLLKKHHFDINQILSQINNQYEKHLYFISSIGEKSIAYNKEEDEEQVYLKEILYISSIFIKNVLEYLKNKTIEDIVLFTHREIKGKLKSLNIDKIFAQAFQYIRLK